ncbi:MAG: hypothetical protein DRZ76_00980 [Candidatus Nealsonbacteria bacterium]|nr:MAG: hypothetical protein DRZ76_00980 [Candidatus Nealsonbacteria bacterium]
MSKLKYPFDVQFFLDGLNQERLKEMKEELLRIGDSLDVLQIEDAARIHIHTDDPEKVKQICEKFGEVSDWAVEDMESQIGREKIGLITTADLPQEIIEKYGIRVVSLYYDFPEKNLEGSFYEKLRKAKQLPITSQLTLADFAEIYQQELEKFDYILVTTLSSTFSGTFNSASQAREWEENRERIRLVDSFNVTIGEGLFVLKANQLIKEGKDLDRIEEELIVFRNQIKIYGVLGDLKFIQSGGRVFKNKVLSGMIGKLINFLGKIRIRPILTLKDGRITIGGIKFGFSPVSLLFSLIKKADCEGKLTIAIGYTDNFKEAEALKDKINSNLPQAEVLFMSEIGPVVGCHAGPGALIIAFCSSENLKVVD